MKAVEAALRLTSGLDFTIECPLMWLDKAGVWRLAETLGGAPLVDIVREDTHTCYQGSRDVRHEWGFGCGTCPACKLRSKGWNEFVSR